MNSKSRINAPSSSSSSSSRRCQSRSDLNVGRGCGDRQREDDLKAEFICPFCAEDYDVLGLYCHIDEEHPVEAKNGVCPLCKKKVGLNIVGHITTQHANVFKQRTKLRRGESGSANIALKKKLREASIKSVRGGSSKNTTPTNIDSDPLLSSFVFKSPSANQYASKSAKPVTKRTSATNVSQKKSLKRGIREAPLSEEDLEKVKKSEFVRGLLLSTMFADDF